MKLKPTFVTYVVGGKNILVSADSSFSGIGYSNKTAAQIIEALKQDRTEDEIVDILLDRFEVTREEAAKDVQKIIEQLRGIGALDE